MKRICNVAKRELERNIKVYKKLLNEAVAAYNSILREEVTFTVTIHPHPMAKKDTPITVRRRKDLKQAIWAALEKLNERWNFSGDFIRSGPLEEHLESHITVMLVPMRGQQVNLGMYSKQWMPHVLSGLKRLVPIRDKRKKRRKAK
jgi:hypothetical protein